MWIEQDFKRLSPKQAGAAIARALADYENFTSLSKTAANLGRRDLAKEYRHRATDALAQFNMMHGCINTVVAKTF